VGYVVQGLDRGRKHAVQKGRRKECVCVCVIERGRGVGAEQERCVYVWRGYGEGAEGGECVYLEGVEEKWEGRRVLHKEKQGC